MRGLRPLRKYLPRVYFLYGMSQPAGRCRQIFCGRRRTVMRNEYIPFASRICRIIRHTDLEYTFQMSYSGEVKPGQFFEVSIPGYGEAPISVSGIGEDTVDLTIRRVGKVTGEIFEHGEGRSLLMRGPYGNGFSWRTTGTGTGDRCRRNRRLPGERRHRLFWQPPGRDRFPAGDYRLQISPGHPFWGGSETLGRSDGADPHRGRR